MTSDSSKSSILGLSAVYIAVRSKYFFKTKKFLKNVSFKTYWWIFKHNNQFNTSVADPGQYLTDPDSGKI